MLALARSDARIFLGSKSLVRICDLCIAERTVEPHQDLYFSTLPFPLKGNDELLIALR